MGGQAHIPPLIDIHLNTLPSVFPEQDPHSHVELESLEQERVGNVLLDDVAGGALLLLALVQLDADLLVVLAQQFLELLDCADDLDALAAVEECGLDDPEISIKLYQSE